MWWILLAATPFDLPEPKLGLSPENAPYRLEAPEGDWSSGDPGVEAMIAAADRYLGTPWRWSGRETERFPGLDCLGLLFLAHGEVTGTSWEAYPYDPHPLVASGRLGGPVLTGVSRGDLDVGQLQRGDVLYFLIRGMETDDAPLWVQGSDEYRPWHTGIYVGEGEHLVLNAHPSWGTVRTRLEDIAFDALFTTRPFPDRGRAPSSPPPG